MAKKTIISSPVVRKEYKYELGNTTLGFTLRQDNTSEMTAFAQLLKKALVDVEEDLKQFKK